jgi:hypothetical protein
MDYRAAVSEIAPPRFRSSRAITGFVFAVAGYALVVGVAWLAGRVAKHVPGGVGYNETFSMVVLLGTPMVALVCLIAGLANVMRGRRDLGIGLLAGMLVGPVCLCVLLIFGGSSQPD